MEVMPAYTSLRKTLLDAGEVREVEKETFVFFDVDLGMNTRRPTADGKLKDVYKITYVRLRDLATQTILVQFGKIVVPTLQGKRTLHIGSAQDQLNKITVLEKRAVIKMLDL